MRLGGDVLRGVPKQIVHRPGLVVLERVLAQHPAEHRLGAGQIGLQQLGMPDIAVAVEQGLGLGIGALLKQQAGQVRNPRGQFAALGLGELGRGVGGHQLVEQHHQSAPGASQLCLHRRHLLGQTLAVAQPEVLPLDQQQALLLDLRNQALEGALRLALRRGRRRYGQQR